MLTNRFKAVIGVILVGTGVSAYVGSQNMILNKIDQVKQEVEVPRVVTVVVSPSPTATPSATISPVRYHYFNGSPTK